MAGVQIIVDTAVGKAKIARILQALEPKTLLDAIGGRFLSWVNQSFKTRGRGKWKPLSPLTLLLRRRGGDSPLHDSGDYEKAFIPERSDGRTFVEVGSNRKTPSGIPLAAIHEEGTAPYTIRVRTAKVLAGKLGGGAAGWIIFGKEVHHPGIPARPVLPTQAEAEKMVQDTANAMLARIIGRDSAGAA